MHPATAAAATMAGLIKWVRAPLPCRPLKLRLEVEAQRWPGLTRSPFIPTQSEHPLRAHVAPALMKISTNPFASACRATSADPGDMSKGTLI